jgi:MoxR-like ATPase
VLKSTKPVLSPTDILELQAQCQRIHVSESLLDYIQALMAETRSSRWFETGLSPRAGIALLHCGKALAFIGSRDFVTSDDIKAIFSALARHRMTVPHGMEVSVEEQISNLLQQVAIP